jgi:hypothetical protein
MISASGLLDCGALIRHLPSHSICTARRASLVPHLLLRTLVFCPCSTRYIRSLSCLANSPTTLDLTWAVHWLQCRGCFHCASHSLLIPFRCLGNLTILTPAERVAPIFDEHTPAPFGLERRAVTVSALSVLREGSCCCWTTTGAWEHPKSTGLPHLQCASKRFCHVNPTRVHHVFSDGNAYSSSHFYSSSTDHSRMRVPR